MPLLLASRVRARIQAPRYTLFARMKVVLGAVLVMVGCSGRTTSSSTSDGGAPVGAGGSVAGFGVAGNDGGGATSNAGQTAGGASGGTVNLPDTSCGPFTDGRPLVIGEHAAPSVAWARVAPFIWGKDREPPADLPTMTSASWASEIVEQAFAHARLETGGKVPGATWFVRRWLGLDDEAPLRGDYASALGNGNDAVSAVLETPLNDDHRGGVFTEQSWLTLRQGISVRGAALRRAILKPAPPHPAGVVGQVDPDLPERNALENAVSDGSCYSCHQLMDPLGIALLHFDSTGAYRESDKGAPVDSAGTFVIEGGDMIPFADIGELSGKLAKTCEAAVGLADGIVAVGIGHAAVSLPYNEYEDVQARVRETFLYGDRTYEALVKAYAQSAVVLSP